MGMARTGNSCIHSLTSHQSETSAQFSFRHERKTYPELSDRYAKVEKLTKTGWPWLIRRRRPCLQAG